MKEILITSSVLILSVIILRLLFRTTVSRRLIYGAWLLVALRLLVPIQFGQLNISILNQTEPVTDAITDIAQRPVSGPSREELYNDALREQISQGGPVFIPEVQEQAESQIQHSGRPAEDVYEEILGSNKPEAIILPEVNRQIETVVEETVSPTLGQIALGIWIIGMVSMAAWFLGVNLSFRRSLRSATESPEPGCQTPVKVSTAIASPCVFGLLRPVIYLTPNCVENMRIRRHVLTHEQTHLRHGDHIWAWVRCILLCIYWFHPLVWIAAILSKRDCELACDEAALKTLGEEEHLAYGKTLVDMVAFNPAPGHLLETATAMHETKKQLKERVNCIVKKPKVFLTAAIALLLVLTIVTGCAFSGPILRPAGIPGEGTTATTQPSETTPTTAAPTTEPTDEPTTQPQAPELTTLTIMVSDDTDSYYSWTHRGETSVWPALEAMLAEKGVRVEWIITDLSGYAEKMDQILTTAEDKPDLIWLDTMSASSKLEYAASGCFTAISDVLPYSDGTVTAWLNDHPEYTAKLSVDGKLWWFGSYYHWQYQGQDVASGSPSGICVREDWMRKLNMTEVPDTVEELEAFLLACRAADVNGNGEPDEKVAFRGSDISTNFLNCFYGVPFNDFSPDLVTGKVETPWESEGVKDMLRVCVDWVKKGYMDERILSGSEASARNQNQLAIQGTYFCDNWTTVNIDVNGGETPVLVGVIPDRSVHPNAYIRRDAPNSTDMQSMAITAGCDNLEAVAALLDVLTSAEYRKLMAMGVEGYSYELDSNGNPVFNEGQTLLSMTGRELLDKGILPDVFGIYTIEEDEAMCASDLQLQQMRTGLEWEARFVSGADQYYATSTEEEYAVLETWLVCYQTVSQNIYQDILAGKINIDTQWESHVLQPLQAAGMDELKAVYQAQFDRFMEAANS